MNQILTKYLLIQMHKQRLQRTNRMAELPAAQERIRHGIKIDIHYLKQEIQIELNSPLLQN
jgi:hypothetical protein